MKSFKLLILLLITVCTANAQTIGDHLNTIREEKPGGRFEAMKTKVGYTYTVSNPETHDIMIYFMNEDLICVIIAIYPENTTARQAFAEVLDENWVRIDNKTWKFYRNDGMVLLCEMTLVEDIGMVFYVRGTN